MSLVITNAGIAASIQAGELGVQYKITHISIGSEGYVPTASQTELRNEIQRKAITKGEQISLGQLHFETVWDGREEFEGKELGYWLEDGTLFAVDSRNGEVITYKRADTVVTEAVELNLSASSLTNITVELIGAPLATERVAGIAKIATLEQVDEGLDDSAFLTVKKLLQRIASASKVGVVQLSSVLSDSEEFAVTPKAVKDEIDILGLGVQMWLGETIPSSRTELDGKQFDKVLNPKMAELFPSGFLPDTRGMILKHAPDGRLVLSFEAEAVKSHGHTASFSGNPLPPHSHHQAYADDYKGVANIVRGAQYAGAFNLNAASAGTPSGTVVVNSTGSPKNLVDNIAVKFIIRKA
ncbi:tail fiber protein [Vibrio scophthalmi]|uniref:tail fiber protein n=1 Tax=Vibrio scophthalmi TaxID=45658 RepID=UPI002283937D|nr:phage tail protein [Vibrio scophthalmi]MCY9805333.1 tail fiber protein [Vibrio scophthalmi]